jgi:hypothetical protein
LDRDLSWAGRNMCLRFFATRMMVATGQKEDSEEERDAATHSVFFRESKCRDWHMEETPSTP